MWCLRTNQKYTHPLFIQCVYQKIYLWLHHDFTFWVYVFLRVFINPIVLFIFYVLASLEIIAEEIEDPFGADTNDLPLEKMALNIHHNLDDILRKV